MDEVKVKILDMGTETLEWTHCTIMSKVIISIKELEILITSYIWIMLISTQMILSHLYHLSLI